MLGSVEGVPAAGALSYMGSNYRPPHQRVHILVRLRVQGNTDIYTNIYGMPVNNERLFQGAQDSAGDSYARLFIAATQQEGKLSAPQARNEVRFPQRVP